MSDRITPILDAIRTKVEALALTFGGVLAPVLVRKAAIRRQSLDPKVMITVSKSGEREQTTRRRFGLWQTAYVIDVVLHCPFTGPDGDTSEYSTARDTIVDALKAPPLVGAPGVFDMEARPADWLRPFRRGERVGLVRRAGGRDRGARVRRGR